MREDADGRYPIELRPTEPLRHLLHHVHAHLQGQQVSGMSILRQLWVLWHKHPAAQPILAKSTWKCCFAGLYRTHTRVRASSRRARGKSALLATWRALAQMFRALYAVLLSCDEGARRCRRLTRCLHIYCEGTSMVMR
jgi:hypothetical protein